MDEGLQATLAVVRVLDDLGISYVIGGSLASSTHGIARSTRDVDFVADLRAQHVRPFIEALRHQFYVSEEAMQDALARRSSFNLIHLQTGFKVDIFVKPNSAFAQSEFDRRKPQPVFADPAHPAFVSSPEDILLHKLVWYRKGGEVSDRQWSDVLGIIKVQGGRLDQAYLRRWAGVLNVLDLLERAWTDAGLKR